MESILNKEVIVNKTDCRIIAVVVFALLTALGAFVRIPLPFTPVPLTLQTFFVLLSGAMLGGNFGFLSQLIYLLLGMIGLPIFTYAGCGLTYLFGPTGGYILGFLFASFYIGKTIKSLKRITLLSIFILMCIGSLIILFSGALWLKILFGYSFKKVILIGFLPFLPGDLLKAYVASNIFLRLHARRKEVF